MLTECPKCQTTLTFEFQNLETGSETGCKHCDVRLKIKVVPEIIFDPSLPIEAPKDSKGTILLCIDGEATREVMKALLETLHYFVIDIPSGASALTYMKHSPPALAFIDSGLSDISGAALCQEIKHSPNLSQSIVILMGSMFEKNAKYRQEAPDWAGADDYIDRHEIQKNLLTKVEHHLSEKETIEKEILKPADQETCKTSLETVSESETRDVVSEDSGISAEPELDESSYLVKGARRLAKIIVSDIVIYNESKVEEGLKQGNFHELLKSEILEGRQLYESRVDKSLYYTGIYEKALETFIEKRTSENIQDIPESEKPTAIFERPTPPTQETEQKEEVLSEVVPKEENRETVPESPLENASPEIIEDNTILAEDRPESTENKDDSLEKDEARQTSETPEIESPEEVFQEMENQAQEISQEPEPALEDSAWESPETLEDKAPEEVFQEMENQAQEIAQEPEPALEDSASESPETLENEAPEDVFQEMETQAQEIAQEPESTLEDNAWESPETLEDEAPQNVFQEMETQAQGIVQEPEAALEDNALESSETLEDEAPQNVFQEMESQAQEIAQ
ncbi:MAG: response regulator, partial [Nitrospirae bacterium]|nr:response regulator [Candidatus Manganitrophaceae bacterium]